MSKRITTHLSRADSVLAALIAAAGPYRLAPELDSSLFQALARAVSHQQLHASAANAILKRFISSCGKGEFPTPEEVLAAPRRKMRAAGFSLSKIAALKDLAKKTLEGVVPERATLADITDDDVIERITQVRGIGRWTVEMMLMFQLQRPDVLPVDDFAVRNGFRLAYRLRGMPRARALAEFGERWKPHRSLAAWYLWRANDLARVKRLPHGGRPPRVALQPVPKKAVKKKNKPATPKRRQRAHK